MVAAGLVLLNDEESAILGECVFAASSLATGTTANPIVACLEQDLARVVASGAVPLTAEQEALVGNCVLSASLGSGSTSLPGGVVACLEDALGTESARVVAAGTATLTDEQQAALGSCRLGSALGPGTETAFTGVIACLTEELGADVAEVVASAVLPLYAEEEQILGNCVLKDALGLN